MLLPPSPWTLLPPSLQPESDYRIRLTAEEAASPILSPDPGLIELDPRSRKRVLQELCRHLVQARILFLTLREFSEVKPQRSGPAPQSEPARPLSPFCILWLRVVS